MNDGPVIECADLRKSFRQGPERVEVLRGVDLQVQAGESVAVVGASGSGKSTLLHLLAGLDRPSAGCVRFLGRDLETMSERQRDELRNRRLGFIYQFHHLLPEFTALENVCLPVLIGGGPPRQARERARELLVRLGMERRLRHRPAELSGGERQRTAIARALAIRPHYLLADEPTGSLDTHSAQDVFEELLTLQRDYDTALVMVTHNARLAAYTQRILELQGGVLQPAAIAADRVPAYAPAGR